MLRLDINILIGGAAGQGIETMALILEKIFLKKGFEVFTIRDYMSRVRGGHNFSQVRIGHMHFSSHRDTLDFIIAMNEESISIHTKRLGEDGIIICEEAETGNADNGTDGRDKRLKRFPLKATASDSGNPKATGSVAIGVLLASLGIDLKHVCEVLTDVFSDGNIASQNIKAIESGFSLVKKAAGSEEEIHAAEPSGNERQAKMLINGSRAIAAGALAAGCRFYSAYPMTPSTDIMNYLASKMTDFRILVEQAEDEIAAINMAIGASYAGVRSMTGTSGGGFSLMVEGLGLAGMLELPLVIAEMQRPGPATGFPTRTEQADLKFVINASQGEFARMVIALKDPEDAFLQTARAFNLADKYNIPVILIGDQYLADSSMSVKPFDIEGLKIERSARAIPGAIEGKTVLVDSDEHDEYCHIAEEAETRVRMSDRRLKKLDLLRQELIEPDFIGNEDFNILLVGWGSTCGPIREAIGLLNEGSQGQTQQQKHRFAALSFGDVWPLPVKLLEVCARTADIVINVEQNATGQLASLIAEQTAVRCSLGLLKYDGRPMSGQWISSRITELLGGGK